MALPTRLGEQGFPLASYGTIRVSCDCPPCWGADSFVPARLSDGFGARGVAHLHTHPYTCLYTRVHCIGTNISWQVRSLGLYLMTRARARRSPPRHAPDGLKARPRDSRAARRLSRAYTHAATNSWHEKFVSEFVCALKSDNRLRYPTTTRDEPHLRSIRTTDSCIRVHEMRLLTTECTHRV